MPNISVAISKVTVTAHGNELENPIIVYSVIVSNGTAEWREELTDKEKVEWLLRGIQACASMYGDRINMPQEYTQNG